MSRSITLLLTAIVMVAFAGNSLLCRAALRDTGIDAASFTAVRIVSGALVLWCLVRLRRRGDRERQGLGGSWASALALVGYAAAFSFAYVSLAAATGALLLFGAVQATMIGWGVWRGERLVGLQLLGLGVALAGLLGLLLPGLSAPPLGGSILMLFAGISWGVYSLRGKSTGSGASGRHDPLAATAGNFVRAAPIVAVISLATLGEAELDWAGIGYAIASGALASGLGYALWYRVLPALRATSAATVQLSVPVIAAMGGAVLLAEAMTLRLFLASVAILGGIALTLRRGEA